MNYRIWFIFLCLMVSTVSFAQNWTDAASVKKELIKAAKSGKTYYSQYNFYNPKKSGNLDTDYEKVLQCQPRIYGVDFNYASGTWKKIKDVQTARENLIKIVKDTWRERRAIASFSWHLENPYVPSGFSKAGFRYIHHKSIRDYPEQHHYIIKEILENSGDVCGIGNSSGKNNSKRYKMR